MGIDALKQQESCIKVGIHSAQVAQDACEVVHTRQFVPQFALHVGIVSSAAAKPALSADASMIAAVSRVYFLNMRVHLRSITVILQTVIKS